MKDKLKNIPQPSKFEKALSHIAPHRALNRYRSRVMMSLVGGYFGASKSRRSMSMWTVGKNDPDSDILPDLPTLRERSRDLIRNTPIATGIINTKQIEVVGTGLKHQARIDRSILGLNEEDAETKEKEIEREWNLFWETQEIDATRILNGYNLTAQAYRQIKENGDVLILLPRFQRAGSPYNLKLQIIEADRLMNQGRKTDSDTLAGGVEKDERGAPKAYHICKKHPGSKYTIKSDEWDIIPAYGEKTGLKNIIHLFQPTRPGQTRGVPDLAPVIELIKMLGSYTTNEALATEIASLFTVFIKSVTGEADFNITNIKDETGAQVSDKDLKLGAGSIIGLLPGEEIQTADPKRPNQAFDAFILSVCRQIGVAVNLPFEILVKHFTASYSAARAALLTAWKYFITERQWLAMNFLQVVKEIWLYEAVSMGRISAPGFFSDYLIRKAYCESIWIGPAKGMIDEDDEISAAMKRIKSGISTIQEETIQLTGGDWEQNHAQRVKEQRMRKEAGLLEIEEKEVFKSVGHNLTEKGNLEKE